jgi:hypothetical protein
MIIEFWKTNENPITCYYSRKNLEESPPKIPKKRQREVRQPVMVESPNGEKEEHKSVVDAAVAIGMNCNTLYAVLNGRAKNHTEYKIYKSQINN